MKPFYQPFGIGTAPHCAGKSDQLEQLPPTGTILVIGILRLWGGSASPATAIALVP